MKAEDGEEANIGAELRCQHGILIGDENWE